MDKLFLAINALKAGESLVNSATWKNRQVSTNALLIVVGAIPQLFDVDLSPDDVSLISYGIAAIGGLFNSYLTVATSEKVGF